MASSPTAAPSLHAWLLDSGADLSRAQVAKPAMVEASHLLEDLVVASGEEGIVLVSCFQRRHFWQVERERYARLAERARVVAVHAAPGEPVPPATDGAITVATVPAGHALASDWFVLVVGDAFGIVLCGRDLARAPEAVDIDTARRFDVLVSTDRAVADAALRRLDTVLGTHLAASRTEAHPPRGGAGPPALAAALLVGMLERLDAGRQAELVARGTSVRLHEQALTATEDERRRLAETLHDDSLQYLLAAQQDLQEVRPGERDPALDAARENLGAGLRNLRRTIRPLYVATRETAVLTARLATLAQAFQERHRVAVDVTVDPRTHGLADEHVVGLVRELLTNAGKHARADRVTVVVGLDARDHLIVDVSDDGVGTDRARLRDAPATGHIGLALAEERVAARGGTWVVDTAPGEGTSVRVTLPSGVAAG